MRTGALALNHLARRACPRPHRAHLIGSAPCVRGRALQRARLPTLASCSSSLSWGKATRRSVEPRECGAKHRLNMSWEPWARRWLSRATASQQEWCRRISMGSGAPERRQSWDMPSHGVQRPHSAYLYRDDRRGVPSRLRCMRCHASKAGLVGQHRRCPTPALHHCSSPSMRRCSHAGRSVSGDDGS